MPNTSLERRKRPRGASGRNRVAVERLEDPNALPLDAVAIGGDVELAPREEPRVRVDGVEVGADGAVKEQAPLHTDVIALPIYRSTRDCFISCVRTMYPTS